MFICRWSSATSSSTVMRSRSIATASRSTATGASSRTVSPNSCAMLWPTMRFRDRNSPRPRRATPNTTAPRRSPRSSSRRAAHSPISQRPAKAARCCCSSWPSGFSNSRRSSARWTSKTDPRMHYHGADGVYAGVTDDGMLKLYWGESKIYKDARSSDQRLPGLACAVPHRARARGRRTGARPHPAQRQGGPERPQTDRGAQALLRQELDHVEARPILWCRARRLRCRLLSRRSRSRPSPTRSREAARIDSRTGAQQSASA